MPVVVTAELVVVVCGVMVSMLAETQYEYGVPFRPSDTVIVLPEVEYELPVQRISVYRPNPASLVDGGCARAPATARRVRAAGRGIAYG